MASNRLEKKDYLKTSLRAFFLQNGFNYGNYQGLGYANVMYPALRKLYKDDDDKLQEALRENIEFFNTNIHFLPFITSLHLVMLENKTPSKEIRNIKMALMGPLAGSVLSGAPLCNHRRIPGTGRPDHGTDPVLPGNEPGAVSLKDRYRYVGI